MGETEKFESSLHMMPSSTLTCVKRETIFFDTRCEIWKLVEEEVRKLASPKGGLEMSGEIYQPPPPDSVDTHCETLEAFRVYWWDSSKRA